ncbi:methyl-accepting chemotaxis protein [Geomesophilobacter sediminis]|uniref:Methyl-accepting chemotaxis protein n=1 Tax=Geomesophilobacter sediminis TaxID=2798584 RepID=A0A8J7LV61_9BACT|nr:methyl-accepting chemotaxis protein [Geomesophilobacter sediminis]MBJ6725414.1 methyl-accepting chemotaxis protein [Geomesophilobacter sediminis]
MSGNFRVGAKLMVAFIMVAAVAALIGGISLFRNHRLNESLNEISAKVVHPMGLASKLSATMQQRKGMLAEAMHESDPARRQALLGDADKLVLEIDRLRDQLERTLATEKERKTIQELKVARDFADESSTKMLNLEQAGRHDEALELLRDVEKATYMMQDAMDKLVADKDTQLQAALGANDKEGTITTALVVILLVVGALVSVVFAMLIPQTLTKPLTDAAELANRLARGERNLPVLDNDDEVGRLLNSVAAVVGDLRGKVAQAGDISVAIASTSSRLYETSREIAQGNEEVSAQAGVVASASEEIASASSEISRTCSMAAEASRESAQAANTGASVVQETIAGMNVIADQVRQAAKTIEALGARSEQIGEIAGTIDEIADQTNLLALNAAIEAARAGEQGRGFAVVADEVRALAERTSRATSEIGNMIKAIQAETRDAVKAMEAGVLQVEKGAATSHKSGEALQEILTRIGEVSAQIGEIAAAAEGQNETSVRMAANVQQIGDVLARSARGADETSGAAAEIDRQARELERLVREATAG